LAGTWRPAIEGAEVLMFQPTDELAKTTEVMMKNFQAAREQA
jgi:hypothetical protein